MARLPEIHRRIIFRDPRPATEPATAREILTSFASRAFRRPAQPAEVDRLMKLYDVARGQGDSFNEAIRLAVEAVLVSPHFLFRLELDPPAPGEAAAPPMDRPAETCRCGRWTIMRLASRLSYFLWSSMPDDELLAAAAAGHLHDPASVAAQARRMLADPKSQALDREFCRPVAGIAPARAAHAGQESVSRFRRTSWPAPCVKRPSVSLPPSWAKTAACSTSWMPISRSSTSGLARHYGIDRRDGKRVSPRAS